jgi:hypothetical protein
MARRFLSAMVLFFWSTYFTYPAVPCCISFTTAALAGGMAADILIAASRVGQGSKSMYAPSESGFAEF